MAKSLRKVGAVRYGLSTISRSEFDSFHSAVLAVFDQGRQRFAGELLTVTNDASLLPAAEQEYVAESTSLGVTFKIRGEDHGKFHIWLNPAYHKSYSFYETLAHELVHGYAGVNYGHSAHWRRWYYRVMWHLQDLNFIEAIDDLEILCYSKGLSYHRIDSNSDELGLVREAFATAKAESSKVKDSYLRRLNA